MATQVLVIWTYSLSDQTGFLLQRSINSASTWTDNYTTDGSTFQYIDSDVVIGGTYWYHVAATNSWGNGSFSNTGSVHISSSGPITLSLYVQATSDVKPFDGTISSSLLPTITPDISVYGDTNSYTQSFDQKFVGDRTLSVIDGTIIVNSGNYYEITAIDPNSGVITGPPTGAIDTGSYVLIPPDTDIPYEDGWFLDIPDAASGSNGYLMTNYYEVALQQVAFTSSNGNNWGVATTMSAELIVRGKSWAYGAGRYLTIGEVLGGNLSNQCVQYTDDGGNTWNTESFSAANKWVWDFIYDGSKFIGCCKGGTLVTSSNGIDWGVTSTGQSDDLQRLFYNSGRYFAVGQPVRATWGGTGTIYTSTDLETWQAVSSPVPTTNAYFDITYAPSLGIYLAVGELGLMATSSNGVDWGDCSQPAPIYDTMLSTVAWNSNESFFAVTDIDGYIYNSSDGIHWTLNTINPQIQFNGNYYYYVQRLKHDSSINKFLVFGSPPPS